MPYKLKTPCAFPGCSQIIKGAYCEQHRQQRAKELDSSRLSSTDRGYDTSWLKVRKMKLNHNSICEHCNRVVASLVHHIKPISTHPHLRLDLNNLQSLCNPCHEAIHRGERFRGVHSNRFYVPRETPQGEAAYEDRSGSTIGNNEG